MRRRRAAPFAAIYGILNVHEGVKLAKMTAVDADSGEIFNYWVGHCIRYARPVLLTHLSDCQASDPAYTPHGDDDLMLLVARDVVAWRNRDDLGHGGKARAAFHEATIDWTGA